MLSLALNTFWNGSLTEALLIKEEHPGIKGTSRKKNEATKLQIGVNVFY